MRDLAEAFRVVVVDLLCGRRSEALAGRWLRPELDRERVRAEPAACFGATLLPLLGVRCLLVGVLCLPVERDELLLGLLEVATGPSLDWGTAPGYPGKREN